MCRESRKVHFLHVYIVYVLNDVLSPNLLQADHMSAARHMYTEGHCPAKLSFYAFKWYKRYVILAPHSTEKRPKYILVTFHCIDWTLKIVKIFNFILPHQLFCNVFSAETQPHWNQSQWKCIVEARRRFTKDSRYLLSVSFVRLTVEQVCAHTNTLKLHAWCLCPWVGLHQV